MEKEINKRVFQEFFLKCNYSIRDKQMEANASDLLRCAHFSCFAIFVNTRIYGSVLCKLCTVDLLGNGRA